MMEDFVDDVRVRNKVYEIGRHMEAVADLAGVEAVFYMGEMMRDWYRDRGMKEKADLWAEVTDYLKMVEFRDARAKIIIMPD